VARVRNTKKKDPVDRLLRSLRELGPSVPRDLLPDVDRSSLARRVREKRWKELEPREVELIADLLEGKLKNPRHRPPGGDAMSKKFRLAAFCVGLQRQYPAWSPGRIVALISDATGVSETYVRKAWRECEPHWLDVISKMLDALQEYLRETTRGN
jgi:hypothetical protein